MPSAAPQANSDPQATSMTLSPVPHGHRAARVFTFYSLAILLTGLVSMLFADLLWRTGWSTSRTVLLVLFILLFLPMAIGCLHGIYGFFIRRRVDHQRITAFGDFRTKSIEGTSTAIIFPIYNEDVQRVYEGLRTTFKSLDKTGELARFDFFILSDSTNPEKWIEEERRWLDLVRELDALGRIYYRRRVNNEGKKSGNVRDFLSNWGRRYRYFIVFDADSMMRGQTVVDLVKLMESNPSVGMIQTVPALVNAESLFGRLQQFANRLYAPIFISGLNYWAQGFGNYWGHNAIIRTEPFMQFCDLPQLPGHKPFGGYILSHDFVEAALLLKENWQAWFAYDLEGSFEEAPQGLIESAQRDRRWCQGNLQHGMVLFARGLRGVSRIHLALGIFGYLSGPLWFLFLVTFCWMRWFHEFTRLSDITVRAFTPYLSLNGTQHAFLIFSICMAVLFLPKILALIDLAKDRERRRTFGGLAKTIFSAIGEILFSTLHAPLQMLWHTRFVITIICGMGVNWGTQNRTADGTAWGFAVRRHWGHTLIGLTWGTLVWTLDRSAFWWFIPVLAGMVLSIPLSVFSSRAQYGNWTRRLGLFLSPEETEPPQEITILRERMALLESQPTNPQTGLEQVVLDPYVNAGHVSLLREKRLHPVYAAELAKITSQHPQLQNLGEKMLTDGPAALKPPEKLAVLSDPEVVSWLHRQAWIRPPEKLHPSWLTAMTHFAR